MSDEEILRLAQPALRRLGQSNKWIRSPNNRVNGSGKRFLPQVDGPAVHALVDRGVLKFGNRCRSFAVLTDEGRFLAWAREVLR